jgi:hypothetical protein
VDRKDAETACLEGSTGIFCVNGFRPTRPNNTTNTSVSKWWAPIPALPVERAVLDLAAIVIRHDVARRRLTEGLPGIWKWGAGGNARRNEVARATVYWDVNSRVGNRDPSTTGS